MCSLVSLLNNPHEKIVASRMTEPREADCYTQATPCLSYLCPLPPCSSPPHPYMAPDAGAFGCTEVMVSGEGVGILGIEGLRGGREMIPISEVLSFQSVGSSV